MTLEMWYVLIIFTVAIVLFVTEWIRLDVVAIGVVVALLLTGLLPLKDALAGFSNSAVIMIAALFVVGGAVMQTGLASMIGRRVLIIAGNSEIRLLAVVMIAVALMSSFMSNTGTVAVFLPAVVSLAWSAKVSPSKLLMPVAFASSLGGVLTLIGTPPNIVVSNALQKAGFEPFTFFSFTGVGIALTIVGIIFVIFVGRSLLPDRKAKQTDLQRVETPDELLEIYRLPESLFRLRVRRGSTIVDQTVAETGLNKEYGLTILEIIRPASPRPVMKLGEQQLMLQGRGEETFIPQGNTILQVDDVLIVQGSANEISHVAAVFNLGIQPAQFVDGERLITDEVGLAEIVLPPRSDLLGKTISQTRFGSLYKLTVLGINRAGNSEQLNIKTTPLEFGDTLLVQGPWQNIMALKQKRHDFVVMGQPESMIAAPNRSKAPITMLIMLGMIIVMITNIIPAETASIVAALLVVLTGCLTIDEAYQSMDWKSLVLIAGMIPMATAMEKVGLIGMTAQWLAGGLGAYGPVAVLAGMFAITSLFTQFISNTATAVLMAPIGIALASNLGVQPYGFLMAIAMAASMSFVTPVASPTNTMVITAGNYRFSDYVKVGTPLTLVTFVISIIVIPLFFPF